MEYHPIRYLKEHRKARRVTYGLLGLAFLVETAVITAGIMVEKSLDKAFNTIGYAGNFINPMGDTTKINEAEKTYILEKKLQPEENYK